MCGQADLLRGLDAKQPKLVASTVTALKQIVTQVRSRRLKQERL